MIRFILYETRMHAASRPMTPAIRTCLLDNDAEREEIVAAQVANDGSFRQDRFLFPGYRSWLSLLPRRL
jgi:hypothetical protein